MDMQSLMNMFGGSGSNPISSMFGQGTSTPQPSTPSYAAGSEGEWDNFDNFPMESISASGMEGTSGLMDGLAGLDQGGFMKGLSGDEMKAPQAPSGKEGQSLEGLSALSHYRDMSQPRFTNAQYNQTPLMQPNRGSAGTPYSSSLINSLMGVM